MIAVFGLTGSAVAQTVDERIPTCLACHAPTAGSAEIPLLGGQPPDYLLVQLYMFREKQRKVDIMNAMAAGLTDDDLRGFSDALAKLPPPEAAPAALDAASIEQGKDLAAKYRCGSCHGAGYAGEGQIPRLAGQREAYIAGALRGYKDNSRAGYEPAMNEVAQEIKAEDIPVLARYLSHMP